MIPVTRHKQGKVIPRVWTLESLTSHLEELKFCLQFPKTASLDTEITPLCHKHFIKNERTFEQLT